MAAKIKPSDTGAVQNSYNHSVTTHSFERRLGGVEYRLANNPGDYAAARRLLVAEGVEAPKLTFPTILAVKSGKVLGLIGTTIKQSIPYMGPLVLEHSRPRPFTAIRLIDSYDNVMRMVGVTAYAIFFTRAQEDLKNRAEDLLGLTPRASTNDGWYYIRRL